MKTKTFSVLVLIALSILFFQNSSFMDRKKEMNILLLPSLPKPIAREYALITSAGQSTDAYIVTDIANQLMIHNYFVPQAVEEDLDGIKTIVFVVGCSYFGEKLHNTSNGDEKKRIERLIEKAKKENLVILTLLIGGKQRRDKKTDELLKTICPNTNYLIGTKDSNYDDFLSQLAKDYRIPITLINGVNDISEPFASAFR